MKNVEIDLDGFIGNEEAVERAPNEGVVSEGAEKLLIEAVVIEKRRVLEWS